MNMISYNTEKNASNLVKIIVQTLPQSLLLKQICI